MRIGHASISEHGTINGSAGDQNGKEVKISTFYVATGNWTCVLRPNAEYAEKIAKACEKGCANNNIGYSQNNRNTAHSKAKAVGYDLAKITEKCNTDCSAFMTLCAIAGGVKELEYVGNAPTTSTMADKFSKTKKFTKLTDHKYISSGTYLKRGDILVKAGKHTVMVLDDGSKANVVQKYYPKYIGSSTKIDDVFKAIGAAYGSVSKRKPVAQKNGYANYSGTATQNLELVKKAKSGTLLM